MIKVIKMEINLENLCQYVMDNYEDTEKINEVIKFWIKEEKISEYDLDKDSEINKSLLYMSCRRNNMKLLKFLIDKKIRLDYCYEEIKLPLPYLMIYPYYPKYSEMFKTIIQGGFDLNKNVWRTVLGFACMMGNLDAVKILMEYGADLELPDNLTGRTPFYNAAIEGHIEIVKYLLPYNPNLESRDYFNQSLLNECSMEIKQIILDYYKTPQPFIQK
jgi:ankyrin repeat protein